MHTCLILSYLMHTHVQYGYLWQVLQGLPLSPDVLDRSDDDDVLQLVVVEIGRSQRHHKVAESDERGIGVGEQADDHVAVQHGHGRLVAVLK